MPKEQPKQSLESQLKMARPRRAEIKRVPLTPEEKEFLGKIMDKAVAAEKAGELQEALNLYTDYKNELLKIKEKEKLLGKEWNRNDVIKWVINEASIPEDEAEDWVDEHFEFDELPKIKTKSNLELAGNHTYETLPNNLYVQGDLRLDWATIKKMPKTLTVEESLILKGATINELPAELDVGENLHIEGTEIGSNKIPANIFVKENVWIMAMQDEQIKDQLYKLKEQGNIKGDIKESAHTW